MRTALGTNLYLFFQNLSPILLFTYTLYSCMGQMKSTESPRIPYIVDHYLK
jgi:hypothetical protein